jgi:hypothetical protein
MLGGPGSYLPSALAQPVARLRAWLDEPVSTPADPSSWQIDHDLQAQVDGALAAALLGDAPRLAAQRAAYATDGEFIVVRGALAPALVARIVDELPALPKVRSALPWARKAAASGYPLMQRYAPTAVAVYRSPVLRGWAEQLAGHPMHLKAEGDPHATAMYYYTKWGRQHALPHRRVWLRGGRVVHHDHRHRGRVDPAVPGPVAPR